ncbi:MAG TPA: hypothetical protein VIJ73_10515 [Methylomirabilota bacterium]
MKSCMALLTVAVLVAGMARVSDAGGCSPNVAGSSNKSVSGTSGTITVAAAASLATPVDTTQTGGAGGGGSQAQTNTAGTAENDGNATGTSSVNPGDQATGITQSGQCADTGINIGGQNLGTVNLGNGNKTVINNGDVLGVVIQNLGGKARAGTSPSITTTINAVNNVGNANGQAGVGRGSRPNQNSTQTFLSQ